MSTRLNMDNNRKFIMEIGKPLFCPVIGTCLTLDEQIKLLKKMKIFQKNLDGFDIHQILVKGICYEEEMAWKIQRKLDAKYAKEISESINFTEDDIYSFWKNGLEENTIDGKLWALITHPALSEKLMNIIYKDIHVYFYNNYHYQYIKTQNIMAENCQNKKNTLVLTEKLKKAGKTIHTMNKALETIKEKNQMLTNQACLLKTEKELLKKDGYNKKLRLLNFELQEKNNKIQQIQNKSIITERLKSENKQLKDQLNIQKDINNAFQKEINHLLKETSFSQADCKTCQNFELCSKHILLVGGITKLLGFYRKLVMGMNGEFKYHDGYIYNNEQILADLIKWADIILCPVNVNSHRACLSVKKFSKKWNKAYYMLSSSGVSSIRRVLIKEAEEMQCVTKNV